MKTNFFAVLMLAVMLVASPAQAFFGKNVVDNAKNLYSKTDYKMVVTVINDGLKNGDISDKEMADAYNLLGQAYKKLGYNSEAKEAFRKALASGAVGYRDNQWILFLDVRQLEQVKEFIFKAAAEDPGARKSMAADIAQLAHNNIASGNLDDATKLFDLAIELEKDRLNEAFNAFFEKGKTQKGQTAEKYADKAVRYAVSQEAKEKAGKLYLKSAAEVWPNSQYESIKNKAVPLVGINFVTEVFPPPETVTVFEKTYTDKDANKDQNIDSFEWKILKPGDIIKVVGNIPAGAEEIYIWNGKNSNPKWLTTKAGYFQRKIDVVPQHGTFGIWIDPKKNIKATIFVERTNRKRPNKDLIII